MQAMKMLHKSFRVLALASLTLLVGVSACKKSEPTTGMEKTLRVLSSEHNFTAEGGAGTIVLSQDGFTAQTEATWLKIGKVEGAKLSYTVEPFAEPSTRTALVVLTRGAERQQVAVTQMGAYSYIASLESSYAIERKGGAIELTLVGDVRPSDVKIEGLPDWVTYKVDGKKLSLMISGTEIYQREASLKLQLSDYYRKTIRIVQTYGVLGYAALLGDYTISYIDNYKGNVKTANVKLVEDQAKKGFILQGLAADIPVAFEEKTNTLSIISQVLPKPAGEQLSLVLGGYVGGYPGANGQPSYSLTWDASFFFSSVWNGGTAEHPSFTFVPSEAAKAKNLHGLIMFLAEGNNFKSRYLGKTGIHTILDFTLTKK